MNTSTFLIKSTQNRSIGTGFCLYQDKEGAYLVTCSHVVEACGVEYLEVDGLNATMKYQGSTDDIDLALLYVEGLADVTPLSCSFEARDKGIEFLVEGFKPFKKESYLLRELSGVIETVSTIYQKESQVEIYELSIADKNFTIERGYSGSAIICERSGEVIAVATDRQQNGKQAYAIPIAYLKEIWKDMPQELLPKVTVAKDIDVAIEELDTSFYDKNISSEEEHLLSQKIEYLPEFSNPNNESYFSQTEQYELFLKKTSLMTKELEELFLNIKKTEKRAFFYFKISFYIFLLLVIVYSFIFWGILAPISNTSHFISDFFQLMGVALMFTTPFVIILLILWIFKYESLNSFILDEYIYDIFLSKRIKIFYFFEETQKYEYEELEIINRRLYIRYEPNTILIYCSFDAFLKGADGFIVLNRDKYTNKEEIEIKLIKNIRKK